MKTIRQRRTFK